MTALRGKVAVITGGAGLLGKAFARAIAEQGGLPVLADHDGAAAAAACDALKSGGAPADWIAMDITSETSITGGLAEAARRHGRVDAIVNSAYPRGKGYGKRFEELTYAEFCETMDLHLGGFFLATQRAAIHFEAQGHGNIVNIASVYGVVAPRFQIYAGTPMSNPVEYGAMKAAIIHMTRYVAKYYKGKGIRANCISPGGILDNQPASFLENYRSFCLSKGMLDTADLEGTLVYLLSDASTAVNGQNLIVDDGFTL